MKMSDSNSIVQQSIERDVLEKFNNKKRMEFKASKISTFR
jgi:hypothetical protein